VGYIIVGAPGQNALDSVDDLLYLAERPVIAGVSVYYPAPGSGRLRPLRAETACFPTASPSCAPPPSPFRIPPRG